MPGLDPYASCPCGSGNKFKWCCHKVEDFANRADRLEESHQTEAALRVLDEGLRKHPGNPWLLGRKSEFHLRSDQPEAAIAAMDEYVEKNPKNVQGYLLRSRCLIFTVGPAEALPDLQASIPLLTDSHKETFSVIALAIADVLSRTGFYPAAFKLFDLVRRVSAVGTAAYANSMKGERELFGNPRVPIVQKSSFLPMPPPESLTDDRRNRFILASEFGAAGLTRAAAAAFRALTEEGILPEAAVNLGLCMLWSAQEEEAAEAFQLALRHMGESDYAVEIQALAQSLDIDPDLPEDQVDEVRLTWPLKKRDELVKILLDSPECVESGGVPTDPNDPKSPILPCFHLLDRASLTEESIRNVAPGKIPALGCEIIIGDDYVALEGPDDGRMDDLTERFTSLVGNTIPPAHPKTKVVGRISREECVIMLDVAVPAETKFSDRTRLHRLRFQHEIKERWTNLPLPLLGGKTPKQAAKAGAHRVALRAAILQLESLVPGANPGGVLDDVRQMLGLDPEPPVEVETLDFLSFNLLRLAGIPVERLGDERLIEYFHLVRLLGNHSRSLVSAIEIAKRRHIFDGDLNIDRFMIYSEITANVAEEQGIDAAIELIEDSRLLDPPPIRELRAPSWDMHAILLRAIHTGLQNVIPDISEVLDRYSEDQRAIKIIFNQLIRMGLIRVTPDPDDPERMIADTRPLRALIAEYGPKIAAPSGKVGASKKPEIWTPGGSAGGSGDRPAIWTPGSGAAPGKGSQLHFPGR